MRRVARASSESSAGVGWRPWPRRSRWVWVSLVAGQLTLGCAPADFARILSAEGELVLSVVVDVADDEEERSRGLRGRSRLPRDEGLLLLFPAPVEACLDTEGVPFEIDAVFFDEAGRVIVVERAIPAEDPTPRCHEGVTALLEVAEGVASEVGPGDALQSSAARSM